MRVARDSYAVGKIQDVSEFLFRVINSNIRVSYPLVDTGPYELAVLVLEHFEKLRLFFHRSLEFCEFISRQNAAPIRMVHFV